MKIIIISSEVCEYIEQLNFEMIIREREYLIAAEMKLPADVLSYLLSNFKKAVIKFNFAKEELMVQNKHHFTKMKKWSLEYKTREMIIDE